ncbi:hypothetical protein N2152v2_009479 [Parachlorella kessleri]
MRAAGLGTGNSEQPASLQEEIEEQALTESRAPKAATEAGVAPMEKPAQHDAPGSSELQSGARYQLDGAAGGSGKQPQGLATAAELDKVDSNIVDGGLQHADAAVAGQLEGGTDAGVEGSQPEFGAVEALGAQQSLAGADGKTGVDHQPAQDAESVLLLEIEEDRGKMARGDEVGQPGQQGGGGEGRALEALDEQKEERQLTAEQGPPAGGVEGGVSTGELVAEGETQEEEEEGEEGGEGAGAPAGDEQHWARQPSEEEAAGGVVAEAGESGEAEQEHTEDVGGEEEVSYGDGDEAADSAAAAAAGAAGGSGVEEVEGPVAAAAAGAPAEAPAIDAAAAAAVGGGAVEQKQAGDRSAKAPAMAGHNAAGAADHKTASGKERRGKRSSPRNEPRHQRPEGEGAAAAAAAGQGLSSKRGREAAVAEGGKKGAKEPTQGKAAAAGGRGQDKGSSQPKAGAGGGRGRAGEGEGGRGKEGDAGGRRGEGGAEKTGGGVARPEKGQEQRERPREHGTRRDPREDTKDRGGGARPGPKDEVPALRVTARPGGERHAVAAAGSPRNRLTPRHGGSARDQPQEHRSSSHHQAAHSPRGAGRHQQHGRDGGEAASLLPPHLRPRGSSQPGSDRGDLTRRQADHYPAAVPDRRDHGYDHGYDRYQPAPDPYSQPAAPAERDGHTRYVTQGPDGRAPRYSTTGAAAAATYDAPRAGGYDAGRSRPAYSPARDNRRSMDSRGGSMPERGPRYGEGARGMPGYPQQAQRGAPLYSKRRELSSSPDPPPFPKRVAAGPYADPYYDPPQRPQQGGYSDGGYPPRYDAAPAAAMYPHHRSEGPPLDGRYRPPAPGGRSRSPAPAVRRPGEYAGARPPLEDLPLRGGAGGGYYEPRDARGAGAGAGYHPRSAVPASGQAPRIVDERGLHPGSPRGGAYPRAGAGAGGYASPRQPRHAPAAAGSGGGSFIPPGYGAPRHERSYSPPPSRGPAGPAGRFGGASSAAEPAPLLRLAADRYDREPVGPRHQAPPTGERYGGAAGGGRAAASAAGGGGGGRRYEDPPRGRAPPPQYDERGYELMPRGPPEGGYARRDLSPEPRGPYDSRGAAPSRDGTIGSRPSRADYPSSGGDYRPRGPPDLEYERAGGRGGPRTQHQEQGGSALRPPWEGYGGPAAGGSSGYDDRRLHDRDPGAEGRDYNGYRGGAPPGGRDPYRDGGGNGGSRGPPGPDRGDRLLGRGFDDERFARQVLQNPRYGDPLPPPLYRDDLPPHAPRYAARPAALGAPLDGGPAGLAPSPVGAPLSPHLLAPPGMLSAAPTVVLQHAPSPAGALLPAGTLQGVPLQQAQQHAVFGQVAAAPLVLPAAAAAGGVSGAGPTPMVSVVAGGLSGAPRGGMARPAVDEEPIWFYTDPQGQKHGPHSISQFRRWLEGLAERADLHAEYQAFKSITVFRPDRPQGVPLMMLLK